MADFTPIEQTRQVHQPPSDFSRNPEMGGNLGGGPQRGMDMRPVIPPNQLANQGQGIGVPMPMNIKREHFGGKYNSYISFIILLVVIFIISFITLFASGKLGSTQISVTNTQCGIISAIISVLCSVIFFGIKYLSKL